MTYVKTDWINTVYDDEGNILRKGTPLMAGDMEKIEQGIVDNETEVSSLRDNTNIEISKILDSKGQSLGIATLDKDGIIPSSQIPFNLKEMKIVSNISERDLLDRFESLRVFVIDATSDATVSVGGAEYLYTNTGWVKVGEQESLDLVLSWANIVEKPTSFIPSSHKHTESQISDLDKYTKVEVDTKLNNKSNANHEHIEIVNHETRITEIESSSGSIHTHTNKAALDNISQIMLNKIHEHGNKTNLDKVRYSGNRSIVDLIELDELRGHNHDYDKLLNKPTIPSKISQIANDSNFIQGNPGKITVSSTAPVNPKSNDIWIVI